MAIIGRDVGSIEYDAPEQTLARLPPFDDARFERKNQDVITPAESFIVPFAPETADALNFGKGDLLGAAKGILVCVLLCVPLWAIIIGAAYMLF
jgi:hypothetical protein